MEKVMEENSEKGEKYQKAETAALSRIVGEELARQLAVEVRRMNRIVFVLAVGLIAVSILAAVGFFRRPRVLVAVQTPDGQRIARIDDVNFGTSEQIQMGEDNLSDLDKKELVNQFLNAFYNVDLASRSKDVPRAMQMMVPESARFYFKTLSEQGQLQRERDEGWSAVWKTDSFEVDRADRNAVQIIGTQQLRRIVGGVAKAEKIQYKLTFLLHTEGSRNNSPLRTGYWIINFKAEELSRSVVEEKV